ncbi:MULTISPECIES: flagellar motor protein [unclassified Neptuniibacter]|jgi:chemotaxis protein MotA|uniref:flagellar motor protein n=1 Tax=unclassified Neptuniibacter TaxID=2630693 RepID=UPI0026E26500|nr:MULTISPECIES: flagellar motor protein [unclassified Neptuniibacter]MDO6514562.1 flagellar motor protein [Neptuniibacter sp. 2_MG-2023]MDO6594728.1 flagellar motor protein [Neptuniibacter sp. 1_MG-2023]
MDLTAILGVLIALAAVLGGNLLEGGQLQELLNVPAAVIVIGGTFAAAIIQSPGQDVARAFRLVGWAFGRNKQDLSQNVDKIVSWCVIARRKGLLALEAEADKEKDSFIKVGLLLLADGKGPDILRSTLEVELVTLEQRDLQGAKVIESMGGYAPTLGIIGAVLGLIHVMSNLSDPAALGAGIATAFVATIYGIGIANLFLIPVANKIKSLVLMRYQHQEMILDGLMSIAEGQNPKAIQQRLQGYLG